MTGRSVRGPAGRGLKWDGLGRPRSEATGPSVLSPAVRIPHCGEADSSGNRVGSAFAHSASVASTPVGRLGLVFVDDTHRSSADNQSLLAVSPAVAPWIAQQAKSARRRQGLSRRFPANISPASRNRPDGGRSRLWDISARLPWPFLPASPPTTCCTD